MVVREALLVYKPIVMLSVASPIWHQLYLLEYSQLCKDLVNLLLCRDLCLGDRLHGIECVCGCVHTQHHL